ncbi:hypothetical protein AYJ54_44480 [Bradyrhizobium centrolobii]|uniref:Uncharacterized protein n=1 Tax=Bradyrhizobium centrolobii TaxID=1505087 RepID=A0A176Z0M2_9BRAD|nr:STM3941 family protein [Bradyrhizobium centrolobii]OAF13388.1 hypothetical protein AYJ54_44480 [Bradyrhizobium centrolobii]
MHTHPDGLALAVADNPRLADAAAIDGSCDLEIGQCASYLPLLVAAGFAMTLLSASLAFDLWDGLGDYDTTIGYAGVALFGLATFRLIWMLPTERGPVVIVTRYGIRDLRIGNEFLLWDSIADVSAEDGRGHKVVVLTLTPALQRQFSCIRTKRAASRGTQADRLVIDPEGLATDFDTLLRACRDCHAASDSRTALRRDSDCGAQGFAARAS